MKNKVYYIGIILSLLFGFLTYFITSNYLYGIGVILLSLIYFLFILGKRFTNYNKEIERFDECYNFVNNFLISLSIKGSILGAFETISSSASDSLFEELNGVKDLKEIEKLSYLTKYFKFDVYRLFVNVVQIWSEEGGDILALSSNITNELREIEEFLNYSKSISNRKLFDLGSLWLFSLAIVIILKLSLTGGLANMLNKPIFQLSVVMFFVLILISIEIYMMNVMKLKIKGWENEK